MYIDGALAETANLPVAKSTSIDDRRVDSFHKYQLPDTAHTVVLKWLNPRTDAQVYLGVITSRTSLSANCPFAVAELK